MTLGNHEFNYGLPLLNLWIRQLGFPALAANAVSATTGRPAFTPYVIKKVSLGRHAPTLRVGILGLTNPGVAIWDRANVEGKLEFEDMIATAAKWVPIMRARGADIVLISAHGGDSGTSSYGPELPNENPSALIAEQVPGIDAILFGHAHNEVVAAVRHQRRDRRAGAAVRAVQVGPAADQDGLHLIRERGRWTITTKAATMLNTNTVVEADPKVLAAVTAQHDKTVAYVNQVVADLDGGAVRRRVAVQGHPDPRLHQQGADRHGHRRAGRRRVRDPAGAVDRRAVQPYRGVPRRATSRSRTWRGSTSTTTRWKRSCSPAPR